MGRPTKTIPALVDELGLPKRERERLVVIQQVIAGTLTIEAAMRRLDLSRQRIRDLRKKVLEGAAAALVPKPPGPRPREIDTATHEAIEEEAADLARRVARLEKEVMIQDAVEALLRSSPSLKLPRRERSDLGPEPRDKP